MMRSWNEREVNEQGTVLRDAQYALIEWLLDPNKTGSMASWAADHNLAYSTVRSWKKDRAFIEVWENKAREYNVSIETTQDIVNALIKKAKDGDVKAIDLFLKYTERYTPTTKRVVEDRSITALSDVELADKLGEAQAGLRSVK